MMMLVTRLFAAVLTTTTAAPAYARQKRPLKWRDSAAGARAVL